MKTIVFVKKTLVYEKINNFLHFGAKMTNFHLMMTSSAVVTSSKKLWCHFVPYMSVNIPAKFLYYCITISKVIEGGAE